MRDPHSRTRRVSACAVALLSLIASVPPARSDNPDTRAGAGADPWQACDAAAAVAEREAGLPPGLLAAIGRVESLRWDPVSRRSAPWPYTLDVGGYDLFMDDAAAAAARVRALQSSGVRSIDVGCFQINLLAHPAAFATIEGGFDPQANAAYAARFLTELRSRGPDWQAAIAAYHSATPGLGEPYRARVYQAWAGAGPAPSWAQHPTRPVASGWMAAIVAIRVVVPSGVAAAQSGRVPAMQRWSGRLPRVITPGGI